MHVISVYYLFECHYEVLKSVIKVKGVCVNYPDPGINLCCICPYHSRLPKWEKWKKICKILLVIFIIKKKNIFSIKIYCSNLHAVF